jgi:hypothetical protein
MNDKLNNPLQQAALRRLGKEGWKRDPSFLPLMQLLYLAHEQASQGPNPYLEDRDERAQRLAKFETAGAEAALADGLPVEEVEGSSLDRLSQRADEVLQSLET